MRTYNERIDAAKSEIKEKEELIKKLLQQQKTQERKDRNHRLCKRGGLVEKLLPELAELTDEQFDTFVEKTLLTKYTRNILAELVPPPPKPSTEPEDGAETARDGGTAVTTPATSVAQSKPAAEKTTEPAA